MLYKSDRSARLLLDQTRPIFKIALVQTPKQVRNDASARSVPRQKVKTLLATRTRVQPDPILRIRSRQLHNQPRHQQRIVVNRLEPLLSRLRHLLVRQQAIVHQSAHDRLGLKLSLEIISRAVAGSRIIIRGQRRRNGRVIRHRILLLLLHVVYQHLLVDPA